MIVEINALNATNPKFGRERTNLNAITEALSGLAVGEKVAIKSMVDFSGRQCELANVRMNIKLASDRLGANFMTRNLKDGNLLHVWRVA